MRAHPRARRSVLTSSFLNALVAFAAASPGQAQTPRLTVIGAGAGVSCAEWAAAGRSDAGLEQWAFGFASAVAAGAQLRRGDDPLANRDADAIHAWLADHCRSRPDEALSTALVRMVYAGLR